MVKLDPLQQRRKYLSISGLSSELIALGGKSERTLLRSCEKYLVSKDEWRGLPPLNQPRYYSGSILLESKKAFCFCGGQATVNLNSIECIQTDKDWKWQILALSDKIAKTSHLAAASFEGSIILFGGTSRKVM